MRIELYPLFCILIHFCLFDIIVNATLEISVDDYIRKITINENTDISLSYLDLIMHTPNLTISIDVVPGDKITIAIENEKNFYGIAAKIINGVDIYTTEDFWLWSNNDTRVKEN